MFSELFYWTLFEYLPPSTGTYLFISYLMKAHSILCPRPLSPAFPSSPCSEWNQAACAFKGGLYLLRTPPGPVHASRLICMWTLTGCGYEMGTCKSGRCVWSLHVSVCASMYARAYAHGYYGEKLGMDLCFLWHTSVSTYVHLYALGWVCDVVDAIAGHTYCILSIVCMMAVHV